ncbi:unnamed protein product [Enterobius vermicularis]|uniref:LRRCT domain-containing protein n=1 Tax=Enterobius vermicularis TaxID=51028 RepID=A0A0N4V6A4_ENTVE|nr:unnamed protein product [Enterobius vermicularis]
MIVMVMANKNFNATIKLMVLLDTEGGGGDGQQGTSGYLQYIPNLIRLEMSEAAVDTIEQDAFQQTPQIQAIVLNKNRISVVRAYFFRGLNQLYSVDLGGNRIEQVEPLAFANLPALRHLDISFNQLQTLPDNTFLNSFQPVPNDRRVMYVCGNPWLCDTMLEWFRAYLRENVDIDIEKPGCLAVCVRSINNCPPEGTPLRAIDFCVNDQPPLALTGSALSMVGRIILAIIMAILCISICLMATVKWAMSRRRKKQKELEAFEDEQRIMSSAASAYQAGAPSVITRSYAPSAIDLDLPQAHTLDDRPNNYLY